MKMVMSKPEPARERRPGADNHSVSTRIFVSTATRQVNSSLSIVCSKVEQPTAPTQKQSTHTLPPDDESNTLTFLPPSTTKPLPARTTWTLLIYLTTCAGGETVFSPDSTRANPNPEPIAVAPEVGMALLHRHGDRCMLHEGREVTGGEKWVIRSDLVVAR